MSLKKNLTDGQKAFIDLCTAKFGPVLTRKQVYEVMKENNSEMQWWVFTNPFKQYRTKRGSYNFEAILAADAALTATVSATATDSDVSETSDSENVSVSA